MNNFVTAPASAYGLATFADTTLLDVWYPQPTLHRTPIAVPGLEAGARVDPVRGVRVECIVMVVDDLSHPPRNAQDAYLRLHLLSHRLVQPRTVNLDGIFGLLTNVAWTSLGPVPVEQLTAVQMRARVAGQPLTVLGVDKFPRMVDYVVPSGVRIADADRVRLGAHLAEGTTVMHEEIGRAHV